MHRITHTQRYVGLLAVLTAALGIWTALRFPVEGGGSAWCFAIIAAFALGSQSVAFPRQRVQLSAADCFLFYTLAVHGPFAAAAVALSGALGAAFLGERKLTPQQVAFNAAAIPFAALVAGLLYRSLVFESAALQLLVAASGFFLVNTALVAAVLSLEGRTGTRDALGHTVPGFFLSVLLTATAGDAFAQVAQSGAGERMTAAVVAVSLLVAVALGSRRSGGARKAELHA